MHKTCRSPSSSNALPHPSNLIVSTIPIRTIQRGRLCVDENINAASDNSLLCRNANWMRNSVVSSPRWWLAGCLLARLLLGSVALIMHGSCCCSRGDNQPVCAFKKKIKSGSYPQQKTTRRMLLPQLCQERWFGCY